jgi:alpha-D-ribose 1-methylphosphonate 5-triphosphate synthase subunit PhnL
MRIIRAEPTSAIVNIAGSACAAGVIVIRIFDDRCVRDVVARRGYR